MHNDIDVESSGKKTKITFGNEEEGSYLFAGFLKGIEAKDSTSALMGVKNSLSVALSSSASASAAGREGGFGFTHSPPIAVDADWMGAFLSYPSETNINMTHIWFQAFPRDKFSSETLQAVKSLLPCRGNAGVSKMLPTSLAQHSTSSYLKVFVQNVDSKVIVNISINAVVSREFLSDSILSTPFQHCPAAVDLPTLLLTDKVHTKHRDLKVQLEPSSLQALEVWKNWSGKEEEYIKAHESSADYIKFTRTARDHHQDSFTVLTNISAVGEGLKDYQSTLITMCDIIPPPTPHSPYVILLDTFKYSTGLLAASRSSYIDHQPNLYMSYRKGYTGDIQEPLTYCFDVNLSYGESLLLQYDCRKVFRHRERFPHDASRGLIVQPAIIRVHEKNGMSTQNFALGLNLLVTSPIPDFSMPFNVITLVTTVAAFLMGAMINVLIRDRKSQEVWGKGKGKAK